jgi:hypothetical protein
MGGGVTEFEVTARVKLAEGLAPVGRVSEQDMDRGSGLEEARVMAEHQMVNVLSKHNPTPKPSGGPSGIWCDQIAAHGPNPGTGAPKSEVVVKGMLGRILWQHPSLQSLGV